MNRPKYFQISRMVQGIGLSDSFGRAVFLEAIRNTEYIQHDEGETGTSSRKRQGNGRDSGGG
jgi:hypothetical protein